MMKKRDTKMICEGLDAQLSQVAMEGVRFFIKFQNNPNLDTNKYYESQIIPKYDSEVLRLVMKHIISGVTTRLSNFDDGLGHL